MGVYSGIAQDNVTINSGTATLQSLALTGPLELAAYTVAELPAAADNTGTLVYVSNGAAGSPVVAFSDGTNWLRVDTKAAVAAA
jgi:hypothetical protein